MTEDATPTREEIAAAARATARLDNADYFETGNVDGMEDYRESAEAALTAALPLIEVRLRGQVAEGRRGE